MLAWLVAPVAPAPVHSPKPLNIFKTDFTGKPVKLSVNVIKANQGDELNFWMNACDSVLQYGQSKISVMHIGDSHIQADYFSGRMRELLQYSFGNGGRGLVFPYRIAKTNNPDNYKVHWTGEWANCKNVNYSKVGDMGICGVSVTTKDSLAGFILNPSFNSLFNYDFKRVKLFSKISTDALNYVLRNYTMSMGSFIPEEFDSTCTWLSFDSYQQKFVLGFKPVDTLSREFEFYGMSLENDSAGLLYHAAGINGAEYFSWNRCNLLQNQMKQLAPHLVIISLGANEGFNRQYSDAVLRENASKLIDLVRQANPDASILITLPGESWYRKRAPIKRHIEVRRVLNEVAAEKHCAVWDLYAVMGGPGSMRKWQKRKLTARDMVHYNAPGYRLQGELLYSALMDYYIKNRKK